MRREPWTAEQIGVLELLLAQGLSYAAVSRAPAMQEARPGVSVAAVRFAAQARGLSSRARAGGHVAPTSPQDIQRPTNVNLKLGQEEGLLTVDSIEFKDPEKALEIANIDLDVWQVVDQTVKFWTTPMKLQERDEENRIIGEKALRVENAHIEVRLKRKVIQTLQLALEGLVERVRNDKPLRLKKPIWKVEDNENVLVIGLFDHHFGKLTWAPETGENYDLDLATMLYQFGTEEILRKAAPYGIRKILFPLGNDFLHIDNRKARTESDTQMEADGRYPKIFRAGLHAVYKAIEYAVQFAPVEVVWIPGNHDPNASYHLCEVVNAKYEGNDDRISVDVGPDPRKYRLDGTTLLGFDHGNIISHTNLPRVMADAVPELWGQSKCREWLTGHYHQRKKIQFIGTDPQGSLVVRTLPSLCGTDSWHHAHGFTGGPKSAEGYIYHPVSGYQGHVAANAPKEWLAV